MSRHARQRSVTDIYHVIQRGIDRMLIFRDDDDNRMYLNLLRLEICDSFEVYCYCLMDNHVHLIIKSNQLSFHISHIASVYAMWFNHKYERSGYLFQDRFKSEVIEEEGYLLRCFRYILRNPVHAGICKSVSAYEWSSYQLYFNRPNSFLSTAFLNLFFDSKIDFQAYVQEEDAEKCMDIDQNDHLTDSEVRKIVDDKLNGKKWNELSACQCKTVLREIMQNPAIRNKQLARITGIGLGIIRHVLKNDTQPPSPGVRRCDGHR